MISIYIYKYLYIYIMYTQTLLHHARISIEALAQHHFELHS